MIKGSNRDLILVIDQGTTGTHAALIDNDGRMVSYAYRKHEQITPRPGWVEYDPTEIWWNVKAVIAKVIKTSGIEPARIAAIGVANQRETVVVWDPRSGKPLYNAIAWRCRRSTKLAERLREEHAALIRSKTGLIPDPYFTGTKIWWLLENVEGLRERAERGEAFFGTVDSWIVWNLTRGGRDVATPWAGGAFVTDYSNASRTMLFDIYRLDWDPELLEVQGRIPQNALPAPMPSSTVYGYVGSHVSQTLLNGAEIPVCAIIGDQQAALFGHAAFDVGDIKATYGTGNFVLANTGDKPVESKSGLLTTIYYSLERNRVAYALEGSIFVAGAVLRWLKRVVRIVEDEEEATRLARSVDSNEGIYFVPAFTGLGAPYWDMHARGVLIGMTDRTGKAHIARAALESIAYMTADVVEAMSSDLGLRFRELRVDGRVASNDWLMQFQADVLGIRVVVPEVLKVATLGAAFLAGLAIGFWRNLSEIRRLWRYSKVFEPRLDDEERLRLRRGWRAAVTRAQGWAKEVPWAYPLSD